MIKRTELEKEVNEFNNELKITAHKNNIRISNESEFIIGLNEHRGNAAVFPLAVCFIVDKQYLRRLYYKKYGGTRSGDVSRYILVKLAEEDFCKMYNNIKKQLSYDEDNKNDIFTEMSRAEILIHDFYVKNNNSENLDMGSILLNEEDIYFMNCIEDYIEKGNIDIESYLQKNAEGKKSSRKYIEQIIENIFNIHERRFIYKIEIVSEFYRILTFKLKSELEQKYAEILVEYFKSIIDK